MRNSGSVSRPLRHRRWRLMLNIPGMLWRLRICSMTPTWRVRSICPSISLELLEIAGFPFAFCRETVLQYRSGRIMAMGSTFSSIVCSCNVLTDHDVRSAVSRTQTTCGGIAEADLRMPRMQRGMRPVCTDHQDHHRRSPRRLRPGVLRRCSHSRRCCQAEAEQSRPDTSLSRPAEDPFKSPDFRSPTAFCAERFVARLRTDLEAF